MATRMRSPKYPSTSLEQAIGIVNKIYSTERTNPVDREVAAQAMGYSGITGRSAKVLSDLIQYGLLAKAGKNEVRVSALAVDVLHPDTDESKEIALRLAAENPELFKDISERFPDGQPSEAALKSFLLRSGFTDAAISPARRAYMETMEYVREQIGTGRIGREPEAERETMLDQPVSGDEPVNMRHKPIRAGLDMTLGELRATQNTVEVVPQFRWTTDGKIWLDAGVVATQEEADRVIAFINAVRPMLKSEVNEPRSNEVPSDPGEDEGELKRLPSPDLPEMPDNLDDL